MPEQVRHINRLVRVTDKSCIDNLRMDRNCFGRLYRLLRDVSGLIDQKFVTVEEQVAMFLGILSHHKKTRPEEIREDCNNQRWKWFEGCLGALDGTYINVRVRIGDAQRFIYVLPGWEGSAADSRILRDALSGPYGLKVPKGNYYLCDNGYANSEGFITPYKEPSTTWNKKRDDLAASMWATRHAY
ncbi:protein ANTAGONIST OF LIKE HETEROCHROMATIN PROTEIN 1-like [Salvia divinorum]|uniref:Protein ANTAGONIST OF LIKE HETEROCHROMATIN PROTEIN 1-like n=1 Tax=Salvia divinorum TaxID=28513 RepID=A0ABD1I9B3_SALDI